MTSQRPYKFVESKQLAEMTHKFAVDLMTFSVNEFKKQPPELRVGPNLILNQAALTFSVIQQIISEVEEFQKMSAIAIDEVFAEEQEQL